MHCVMRMFQYEKKAQLEMVPLKGVQFPKKKSIYFSNIPIDSDMQIHLNC